MEPKDWITLVSVGVVIFGWIYNGHKTRQHEIFKRKMDLRFGMYESCIEVVRIVEKVFQSRDRSKEFMDIAESEFISKLEHCHVQVLMYGTELEIRQINAVVELLQQNKHLDMRNELASLMRTVRKSVREDLKLQKLPEDATE
jgi:hypothetical protein